MTSNMNVTSTMKGTVVRISGSATSKECPFKGTIMATKPKTKVIVIILSPITLPMDISCSPAKAANMETAASGIIHPTAVIVSPT